MLNSKFEAFKIFLKNKKVLITTHDLVDIDGFVSCFVLKFCINQYFNTSEAHLIFPKISKSTSVFISKVAEKFPKINFSSENDIDISKIDVILILDTNNLDQIKFPNNFDILNSEIPFIFVDHHINLKKEYKGNITALNIIIDEFTSTAEIIFELCEEFNVELTLPYKYLLIAAILTDSGFFKHGNNDTIIRVSKLLNDQLDFQDILSTLRDEKNISAKLAKIKALQRVQIIQEGDWLIGVTHVGSFEANAANSLIKIGFDVGIVYSEKKTEFRISTRAKKSLCLRTGLHLGKILEEVSDLCGGSGGGHDGAASINGKVGLENIVEKIVEKIKNVLTR